MNNISFQSRIRITDINTFNKEVRYGKKNLVNYPWTKKESVLSDKAATTGILDCTCAGFTDGVKVLLMHICPTNPENKNLKSIDKYIKNKIDLTNPNLQGFILGSKNNNIYSPNSPIIFDFFVNLMKNFNIRYSEFRGGDFSNNVAYSSLKDEWIIGSDLLNNIDKKKIFITPQKAVEKIFDKVQLDECDELFW